MTKPTHERTRVFVLCVPSVLAAAFVVAVAVLVLAAPGTAQPVTPDAPPKTGPGGPNPLGTPTVERATAPVDERGPSEGVAEEPVVRLPDGTEAVADELIVSYGNGVASARQTALRHESGTALKNDFPEIDAEVVSLEDPAGSAAELEARKAEIEADPAVEAVDYNYVVRAAWSPNDPYFRGGSQGNIRAVDALRAWNRSWGGVRVAVLDSGCYRGHLELNEGKVVAQTDKYYGDGTANDENGHGTHVSSTLAADTNNGVGIAGGAPGAQILCAKVLSNSGTSTTDVVMDGMRWAKANGARVVNMSLTFDGTYQHSFAELTASMYRSGIFVVAASGNDNAFRRAVYPAAYPSVMAVAGTERDGTGRYLTQYGGSNWGPYVDIAAPGEGIWGASISGSNKFVVSNGTSMATPHVAAAGALLASRGARAPDIFKSLRATADDRGARGRDDVYGSGLVDFHGGLLHYQRSR